MNKNDDTYRLNALDWLLTEGPVYIRVDRTAKPAKIDIVPLNGQIVSGTGNLRNAIDNLRNRKS
jgi:hypothetical protein